MSNHVHDFTPIYGEAAYLDSNEIELIRCTKGHRLAVLPDEELPDLMRGLADRCVQLRLRLEDDRADPASRKDLLANKLEILSIGMRRVAAEGERRNLRLDAADLNAFTEDFLGVDIDGEPHRRGSAQKFARTIGTAHSSEGTATATPPRE